MNSLSPEHPRLDSLVVENAGEIQVDTGDLNARHAWIEGVLKHREVGDFTVGRVSPMTAGQKVPSVAKVVLAALALVSCVFPVALIGFLALAATTREAWQINGNCPSCGVIVQVPCDGSLRAVQCQHCGKTITTNSDGILFVEHQ